MSSVHLYIYDLSRGLAKQLSLMFIGKQLEGIWHTGIVAYGREWFFGGNGIENVPPKGTLLGEPNKIEHLGRTEIEELDFLEMVQQLSDGPFRLGTYNLLKHNCNTFSDQLAQFLLGKNIPKYIIDLPNEVLQTPLGSMLEQMFAPQHTLISNVNDTPISHINKKTGKTLPLSSASVVPSIPTFDGLFSRKTSELNIINEQIRYKPEVKEPLNYLIKNKKLQNLDENQNYIFDELIDFLTKSYLEKTECTWSIGRQHIKLLFKLLENNEDIDFEVNVLKLFQIVSNDKNTSKVILSEINQIKTIISGFKSKYIQTIEHYFQWFTNMATAFEFTEWFMKEQDLVFLNLCEYLLFDIDLNRNINKFSVTFFYNLLCTFDGVYKKLNESSGLTLGCALIELIQSEKFDNDEILFILDLLQVTCAESEEVKLYVESIGGLNLKRYIHDPKCKTIIDTISKHLLIHSE